LNGSLGDVGGAKLLTSSNDGSIRLWDLARSSPHGPLRLGSYDVHARQSGGIFAMHEVGLRVLTASKDRTVALTQLRADGGADIVSSFDSIHSGAVRSVRWSHGAHTFVSGATTGDIVLSDTRAPAPAEAAAMRRAHSSAVNTLAWCGAAEHVFLSSSCDATMLLHDVRKPSTALATLVGHTRLPRQTAINQPTFCDGGRFVVSIGEGSPHLSLFCSRTGEMLSQGELGDHVLNKKGSCLHALGPSDDEALVLANGNFLLAFLPERAA
jgi:WD40 repeat protein